MTPPVKLIAMGECMIELRAASDTVMRIGFGGDTANTAIYLAHYGSQGRAVTVDYLTAVGDDPYSRRMTDWLTAKGVGTGHIRRIPDAAAGLYLIDVDSRGERSFVYYRDSSAARRLLDEDTDSEDTASGVRTAVTQADWVYLSGITAAILPPRARRRLNDCLDELRSRGGKVAFDTNYRPVLWGSAAEAREAVTELLRRTDLALPTQSDEHELFGDPTAQHTARRLHDLGVREVAVKLGRHGVFLSHSAGQAIIPAKPATLVDSTAAGDAFNAGYLNARLRGGSANTAARDGVVLAAAVVGQPGAIVPPGRLPRLRTEEVVR